MNTFFLEYVARPGILKRLLFEGHVLFKTIPKFIQLFLFLVFYGFMATPLSNPLAANNKTESLKLLELKEFKEGEYTNLYLTTGNKLELAPKTKELFSLADLDDNSEGGSSVIWKMSRNEKYIVVMTGSEGEVYFFDAKSRKFVQKVVLPAPEVVSMVQDEKGNYYFGTGPNGGIYFLDSELGRPVNLVESDEQFIWDLLFLDGDLYYATGGEGAIYRIDGAALDANKIGSDEFEPIEGQKIVTVEEPNILKLDYFRKGLYFSTSDEGKLYRILEKDLAKLVKDSEKDFEDFEKLVKVVFDGGNKDITDFVFSGGMIYLATAGSGSLKLGEKNGDGFKNYVIRINQIGQMEVLYHFTDNNISSLVKYTREHKGEKQPMILIGLLEDMKTYLMDTGNLPRIELIHFNKGLKLSSIFRYGDEYLLSSANTARVFELRTQFERTGTLITKVIDLKRSVQWGNLYYELYQDKEGHINGDKDKKAVDIFLRTGDTSDQSWSWSQWFNARDIEKLTTEDTHNVALSSRFVQFKVVLYRLEDTSPVLGDLKIYYSFKNLPHRVVNIKIGTGVNQVGGIFQDEQLEKLHGMANGIDSDQSSLIKNNTLIQNKDIPNHNLPFLNYELKDVFSLSWEAINPDNDQLKYRVEYLVVSPENPKKSYHHGRWRLVKDGFLENFVYFDKKKFFGGKYQFKIVSDDYLINGPIRGFQDEQLSPVWTIDNKAPEIYRMKKEDDNPKQIRYRFSIKDSQSRIKVASYTYDHKTIFQLVPDDGVFDEQEEDFQFTVSLTPENHQINAEGKIILHHQVIIFAQDDSDNFSFQNID